MSTLTAFNFITLNGYFKGPERDISWHKHGREEGEFAEASLKSGNTLLFGRVTYEMMASYWPTHFAIMDNPAVADGMNKARKVVFSTTLKNPEWKNTTVINSNIIEEVKKLKAKPGKNMTLLGSGSILTQLANHNLIDEYQIMIDPVALGNGTSLFKDLNQQLHLELTDTRTFSSGVLLLTYQPVKNL